jgi:hypothetical protein
MMGGDLSRLASVTRVTRLRARAPAARRGRRELPTAAAVIVDVLFVLRFSVVEPGVGVELILVGRAILAEAFAHSPAHGPYRVLDELHQGAEDGVRCAMKIHVRPRVGQIRFDALLVLPEGVAFWEFVIMSAHPMLACSATQGRDFGSGCGVSCRGCDRGGGLAALLGALLCLTVTRSLICLAPFPQI